MSRPDATKLAERARRSQRFINDEDDAAITAAAKADPDAQPWTEADFARAVPFDTLFGSSNGFELAPDVAAHFRASGPGWQKRINEILRKAADLA